MKISILLTFICLSHSASAGFLRILPSVDKLILEEQGKAAVRYVYDTEGDRAEEHLHRGEFEVSPDIAGKRLRYIVPKIISTTCALAKMDLCAISPFARSYFSEKQEHFYREVVANSIDLAVFHALSTNTASEVIVLSEEEFERFKQRVESGMFLQN